LQPAANLQPTYHRMDLNDTVVTELLSKRDETAFEQVFRTYFKDLHAYAFTILRSEAAAEEVVQNVFFKLWERAGTLNIGGPIAAYLYRAVHNESLNHIKHLKVRTEHKLYVSHRSEDAEGAGKSLALKELESRLQEAMKALPEQCRTIFQMSRFEELRYREIADRLDISVKTVENQMGKALKILRAKLVDLLPLTILFFTT
jgi:RNA polymerase sigma-70 factor (ECF subfamily)